MTYRIGIWAVLAAFLAQTAYYQLLIIPDQNTTIATYRAIVTKYSTALDDAVVTMDKCTNLLDRMNERIEYLKGYISTACAPDVREEMSWNR